MVYVGIGLPVFDVQADLLTYLAQEALAHAALIFATLAAAFTFAAGFSKKLENGQNEKRSLYVYGSLLSLLFLVAIYAFFRFVFYAGLSDFLLNQATPPGNSTLTYYWSSSVRNPAENNSTWLILFSGLYNVGLSGLLISSFLAYLLAFFVTLLASGLLGYSPRRSLIRVVILVAGYIAYLIVSDYFITDSTVQNYAILTWAALFVGWALIYADRWMHVENRYAAKCLLSNPHRNSKFGIRKSQILFVFFAIVTLVPVFLVYSPIPITKQPFLIHLRNDRWFLTHWMSIIVCLSIMNSLPIVYGLHKENSFIESAVKQNRPTSS